MSTTRDLAHEYRQQFNAEMGRYTNVQGERMNTCILTRKAYWKAYKKIRAKIYPRGADRNNIVLRVEGMI